MKTICLAISLIRVLKERRFLCAEIVIYASALFGSVVDRRSPAILLLDTSFNVKSQKMAALLKKQLWKILGWARVFLHKAVEQLI